MSKLYRLIVEDIIDYSGLDEKTYKTAENILETVRNYVTDLLHECAYSQGDNKTLDDAVIEFRNKMKLEKAL